MQHACQSACLSHAGTVSKQLNISWDFFHHWVATAFWFFRTKLYDYIPTGTPVIGTFSAGGGVKIVIFDQCLALSWKWYKSPSYYGKQIGNCTQGSNGTSFNDLKWPLTQSLRLQYYSAPNNLKMVQDRAILTMADQWKIVYGLSNGAIFLSRKSQFLTPLPCIQCPHYRGPCRNIVIISYRNHCHNIVILS